MIFFTKESLVANLSQRYPIYDRRLVQGESKCSFVKCAQIKKDCFFCFSVFFVFLPCLALYATLRQANLLLMKKSYLLMFKFSTTNSELNDYDIKNHQNI